MNLVPEQPLWKRLAIAVIIFIACVLFVFLVGMLTPAEPQQREPDLYQGIASDAKLLELDKRALDEAYHVHLIQLWKVWLTDGAREAHRFTNGLRIARAAYVQASEQIARRESELKQRRERP